MNGFEIEKALRKTLGETFKGVFSCDEWKKIPLSKPPAAYVFNTSPSSQDYGHWCSTFVNKNREAIFFDSFGRSPTELKFDKFLKRHSKSWKYSNVYLQNPLTAVCGQHVIIFLITVSKKTPSAWLKLFTSDLLVNDELVLETVNRLYGLNTSMYPSLNFIM